MCDMFAAGSIKLCKGDSGQSIPTWNEPCQLTRLAAGRLSTLAFSPLPLTTPPTRTILPAQWKQKRPSHLLRLPISPLSELLLLPIHHPQTVPALSTRAMPLNGVGTSLPA